MIYTQLSDLEREASNAGLLLRVQVNRPLNLWTVRIVVAVPSGPNRICLLGELKAWAYKGINGLQLDTMKVSSKAKKGVGDLIWAATMAWALEETPCRKARLLAIHDEEYQHLVLLRYFKQRGFFLVREVTSNPFDLPLRMIWGGAGSLMSGSCIDVFDKSLSRMKTFGYFSN